MSNRLFQGIIHQMHDAVDRVIGVVDDSNKIKQFFAYIISQDDIMDAMTGAMKNAGGLI